MKTLKNKPQKLLIIGPKLFFHSTGPAAQTSPELIFHIINMSQDSSVSLSVTLWFFLCFEFLGLYFSGLYGWLLLV